MDEAEWMQAFQWLGFAGLIIGTWYYSSHFDWACLFTMAGCLNLAVFAYKLTPTAWGLLAVQIVVAALTLRNFIRYKRHVRAQS